MSIAAYKRTIIETEAPRQIERRILAQVTGQLEQHQEKFDASGDLSERLSLLAGDLRACLWDNEQVWLMLRSDLSEPENALPPQLRAGLLSIALWIERQTNLVMRGTGNIGPLVEVNRSIIRGLAGDAGTAELQEA
ncbi:flagellar biosynthesis regulator FlaF [Acidimangrovimonas pyrenivorans]|uniref:Flagellar biosynthesis regulator FlaF n=1 Tax=Acidimangrovimonas pyrenivorans TaxID=2030798 RepID=A0ABV7ANN4_9RHOB